MKGFTLFVILASVAVCGCVSNYYSQTDLFSRMHPDDAVAYKVMAPTSVEFIEDMEEDQKGTILALISGVRKRQEDIKALAAYLDKFEELTKRSDKKNNPDWQCFKRRLRSGDALYYFSYMNGEYKDYGLLVLRRGTIVYRYVWGWFGETSSSATKVMPANMNYNHL